MTNLIKEKKDTKYNNYGKGCLDIGKEKNYCYVESPGGRYLKVFSFENNEQGAKKCLENLRSFQKSEGLEGLLIGSESTGSYGDAITSWLDEQGIKMVGVNPKHVSRMKELVGNSPLKSDRKDPQVGTMIVTTGKYNELLKIEGTAAELRALTKSRKQLKIGETRIINHLESHVARVFPEFLQVMKSLDRVSSLYLLKNYPLPSDIVSLGKSKLLEILRKQSRYQLGEKRRNELYNSAKTSIGVTTGLNSISLIIKGLVVQKELIVKQIKETEKAIKEELYKHEEAEYLLSIPGLGIISVSELIGETGGLNQFTNSHKLIKLAGYNLYEISSGKHKGQMRITRRGRSSIRQCTYLAALRMVKKNGIFRTEYEKYTQRMKKPQALVAIAKKLLRVAFSLAKNKKKYTENNKKSEEIKPADTEKIRNENKKETQGSQTIRA